MRTRSAYLVALAVSVVLFMLSRTEKGKEVVTAAANAIGESVRGIRNKNPGNLRANQFRGSQGVDGSGYAIFDTMQNGVRGSARQLVLYFSRGINTVEKIISTWAPSNENNTAAYVAAVAKYVGVNARTPLVLTEEFHAALMRAIFRHELGVLPSATITDAMIIRGIREA